MKKNDYFKLIRIDGFVLNVGPDDAVIIGEFDDGDLNIELLDTGEIIRVRDRGMMQ